MKEVWSTILSRQMRVSSIKDKRWCNMNWFPWKPFLAFEMTERCDDPSQ
jgi:hypothetical protein